MPTKPKQPKRMKPALMWAFVDKNSDEVVGVLMPGTVRADAEIAKHPDERVIRVRVTEVRKKGKKHAN